MKLQALDKIENASPRGSKTKRLILDTAMKIASTYGIQGVTIGDLAKKIGMSKSGLFAHFENKDNLQLEILQVASNHFSEKVLKPAFQNPRGLPRLEAMFENWLEYLNDGSTLPGGSIFIAASFELDDRPGLLKDFVQNAQNELILNIEKAVQFAIEEGHFKKTTNKHDFAWKLYSYVLGYHHFKRMLHNPGAENFIQQAFKELINLNRNETK
jgi:AcrR family transcriptional regulator